MRKTRAIALLAVLAVTLSACAHLSKEPRSPEPTTTLQVENQAYLDMTIYVLRGAERVRLGIAAGNSTSHFVIPRDVIFGVSSLSFVANPIGGTHASVSETINVAAGDEVVMQIPPN